MFFPSFDVSVTASSLDHNGPAGDLAQKWAGVFCEWMEGETVDGNQCDLDSSSALERCFNFSSSSTSRRESFTTPNNETETDIEHRAKDQNGTKLPRSREVCL
jgi:hypothetical protein